MGSGWFLVARTEKLIRCQSIDKLVNLSYMTLHRKKLNEQIYSHMITNV